MMRYEWDADKAATNLRKHRVSFETACLVFRDPLAFTEMDRIENGEYRWQTIGWVNAVLILLVAHTEMDADVTRIISARKATPQERRRYGKNRSI